MNSLNYAVIATIRTDLPTKFGVPRQSGIAESLTGKIVFEPQYRNIDSLRGLEKFSHLWAIWDFSLAHRDEWSPTVRPPRLGGNTRLGVFATRSPFRPNPIGLSSLKIIRIEIDNKEGPVIYVQGIDMVDGTPIIDIKPYIPYTDSHPEASGGFVDDQEFHKLDVGIIDGLTPPFDEVKMNELTEILENDPRPQYHDNPDRVYGLAFSGRDVRFRVDGNSLTITDFIDLSSAN